MSKRNQIDSLRRIKKLAQITGRTWLKSDEIKSEIAKPLIAAGHLEYAPNIDSYRVTAAGDLKIKTDANAEMELIGTSPDRLFHFGGGDGCHVEIY